MNFYISINADLFLYKINSFYDFYESSKDFASLMACNFFLGFNIFFDLS